MPDISKLYADLDQKELTWLHNRYAELRATAPSGKEMTDEALQEIVAITSILRRRSSGPPKAAKQRSKVPASIDDL